MNDTQNKKKEKKRRKREEGKEEKNTERKNGWKIFRNLKQEETSETRKMKVRK